MRTFKSVRFENAAGLQKTIELRMGGKAKQPADFRMGQPAGAELLSHKRLKRRAGDLIGATQPGCELVWNNRHSPHLNTTGGGSPPPKSGAGMSIRTLLVSVTPLWSSSAVTIPGNAITSPTIRICRNTNGIAPA